MKSIMLAKTALGAINRHRGRSLLTVLGIMVGVAAIIVTFSIGRGAEEKIRAQIRGMGEGTVMILPGNVITPGGTRSSLARPARLTVQDLDAIRAQVDSIHEISRGTFGYYMMEYGNKSVKEQLLGADDNVFKIFRMSTVEHGIPFTQQHVTDRSNVAVIGFQIKEKLFGAELALDQTIRIGGFPFAVIGILKEQPHYFGTEDPNAHVFVPFTTAKKYFKKSDETDDDLGFIAFNVLPGKKPETAVRAAKRILRLRHNIRSNEEDDFMILDQETIAETANAAGNIIKLFGLLAASISLLVGGIGIMNIMLVSVTERTKEIGLRIAIGATRTSVQLQFLIESALLCAFGGLLGITTGLIAQWFIRIYTILPSITEFLPAIISFIVTILLGIFFGFYPALRASRLNPIDALTRRNI